MKDFFAFLKSRLFLKNLALAFGIAIGILILTLLSLRIYTHHNHSVAVPDFSDLPVEIAEQQIENRKLRFEIFDSIFVAEQEKGVVIDQHPKAGSLVKKNRKIYLTINANAPEKIVMPDLVGITLREARTKISVAGLKLGKLRYRYDMAKNVVLIQEFHGEEIPAGDTILKGSMIDLVLGKGLSDEKTMAPDLIGLNFEEAKTKAADAFFTTSNPIADQSVSEEDTLSPFIYRQHPIPSKTNLLPLGTQITIWVTLDSTKLPGYSESDSVEYAWPELNEVDDVEITDEEDTYDYNYSD
jgi:beta-lactam-binding protein with PASTA domain